MDSNANVRSVTARLNAEVAKYIADIKMAGRVTQESFDGANKSVTRTDESLRGLTTTSKGMSPALQQVDGDLSRVNMTAGKTESSIDKLSGRVKLVVRGLAMVGPGALAIGAVAVPAITGLAGALGAAGLAGAALLAATQGVGDALKAVEAARLDPTTANLQAAQAAMAQLGPQARQFVREFQEFRPVLRGIRDASAAGLFPEVTKSLDDFEAVAPRVEKLFYRISRASGEAIADGAESLAGDDWKEFFDFLSTEAPATINSLSKITGSLTRGLASMWMEFSPGNQDFLNYLEKIAASFDSWSSSDKGREDIASFLAYVEDVAPKVEDLFVAIVDALTQVAQAAGPLAGQVLPVLTAMAKVVGAIADSDLGTPIFATIAAISTLKTATAAWGLASKTTMGQVVRGQKTIQGELVRTGSMTQRASTGVRALGQTLAFAGQSSKYASKETLAARSTVRGFAGDAAKGAALVGGLTLATSGLADGMGLSNTASLALMGTIAGPWGAAVGGGVGLVLDFASANKTLEASIDAANAAIASGDLPTMTAQLEAMNKQLRAADDQSSSTGLGDTLGDIFKPSSFMGNLTELLTGQRSAAQAARDNLEYAAKSAQAFADSEELWRGRLAKSTGGLEVALAGPLGEVGAAYIRAAANARTFTRDVTRANNLLQGEATFDAYSSAILDAGDAIEENGRTLDKHTRAGLANRAVLRSLASTALAASAEFKGLSGVGKERFLSGAREEFIKTARAMGMGNRAAALYANELKLIGKTKTEPDIGINDREFQAKGNKVVKNLRDIDNKKAAPFVDLFTGPFTQGQGKVRKGMQDLDRAKANPTVSVESQAARNAIANIRAALASIPRNVNTTVTTTSIRVAERRAEGGFITGPGGPRDDVIPALLSNGEYVVKAAAVDRYGVAMMHKINAMAYSGGGVVRQRYADGGGPGRGDNWSPTMPPKGIGGPRSTERTLSEVKQIMADIRDLKRLLDKDGKDELSKQRKKAVALELKAAEKRLKVAEKEEELQDKMRDKLRETRSNLQGVGSGFSLESLAPDNRTKTVVQGAQATIAQLRRDVMAAGGVWSKDLVRWSKGLLAASSELDDVNAALARETTKRDALVSSISEQQQALDQLTSTMKAFGDSVAGNFLTNPFSARKPGEGGGSPELVAAQEQLKAIRNSATGDSVEAAARASELIAQIKKLQGGTAGDGDELTGVARLRKTLLEDAAAAEQMTAALRRLTEIGLDTTGAMGGLYKSLAESGDLQTAQELAALTAGQVDEYEKLFAARENAAAVLAAQTTQAVYGQQQAQLQASLAAEQAALVQVDANITKLNATTEALGVAFRALAPGVAQALKPQIDELNKNVKNVGPDVSERLRRIRAVR